MTSPLVFGVLLRRSPETVGGREQILHPFAIFDHEIGYSCGEVLVEPDGEN